MRSTIDLPIYPVEAAVMYGPPSAQIGEITGSTILRAARVQTPRHMGNLKEVLKRTDEELEIAAEMFGATVLKHTWGLYPIGRRYGSYNYERFVPRTAKRLGMPEDHILVAKTAAPEEDTADLWNFVPKGVTDEHIFSVQAGIKVYLRLRRSPLRPQLSNVNVSNVVVPTQGDTVAADAPRTYIGLEPVWSHLQGDYSKLKAVRLVPTPQHARQLGQSPVTPYFGPQN